MLAGLSGEIGTGEPTQIGRSSRLFDQDAPAADPEPVVAESAPRRARKARTPGTSRWVPAVVAAVLLLALGAAGVAVAGTVKGSTVAVPSLVGLTTKTATDKATAAGLSLHIVLRNADDPKDTVIGQDPAPGTYAADGSEIELIVSRGPPPVPVPDVAGKSPEEATATLQTAGFLVQRETPYDETVPAGTVIGTDPKAGTGTPRDSTVKLLVSNGPAPVTVPDVSKQTYDQASATLTGAGFTVTRADVFDATIPKDQVVGTTPAAGTAAPRGSQITINVSKGPELIAVPNLVGKSLETATAQLQGLGFVVDTQSYLPGRVVHGDRPRVGDPGPQGHQGHALLLIGSPRIGGPGT